MSNTDMVQMASLAKGLAQSSQNAASNDGSYMQFTKFGEWVWGSEKTEVEEDAVWAIHPQGFQHGWIGWGDKAHNTAKQKLGEILVAATEPLPPQASLEEIQGSWNQQISMQMVCLSGFDKGVKVCFNSSSMGGRNAYASVINEVVAKINSGGAEVCPVVTLENSHYDHKDFGKIFTPVMTVTGWKTMGDLADALAEAEAEGDGDQAEDAGALARGAETAEKESEAEAEEKAEIEADAVARKAKAKAKSKAADQAKLEASEAEDAKAKDEEKPTRTRRTRRTR